MKIDLSIVNGKCRALLLFPENCAEESQMESILRKLIDYGVQHEAARQWNVESIRIDVKTVEGK
ncbi:MAG: hypothetical protein PHV42_04480 [Candidatus Pacebacteria bacterium]|nr:hypothetical protein [Candidatus Paceibacterota bacterium]